MALPLDDNLRRLFRDEADERLGRLDEALDRVERGADDEGDRRALVREAHTLKGAAAMAGLHDVEDSARALEGSSRALPAQPSADDIGALRASVDALRSRITAALGA